ncbi:MAG TPA: SGNH/GDSL hydrolase family protein [Gammaproteobacteria bacterium]|nr:SGNH/GDSL hydrolase family protein [Gammaproteobacteria bacterium]
MNRTVEPDDFRLVLFGYPFQAFQDLVLVPHAQDRSQIQIAVDLEPSTVVLWLGSNDVLWAVIGANPLLVTPPEFFKLAFITVLDRLTATEATIVVGNVPDVSVIPFTRPAGEFLPPDLFALLGITAEDRITLPGIQVIGEILAGNVSPPLGDHFVLTPNEAIEIQLAVDDYNAFISDQVAALRSEGYPIALADINSMLNFAETNGVVLAGRTLTTELLGGLFTLDGIHPTNTAHAIVANAFINVLNAEFNTGIRPLSVGQVNKILHKDPLVFKNVGSPRGAPGSHGKDVVRSLRFIGNPIMSP